jgi:hypothetical protein
MVSARLPWVWCAALVLCVVLTAPVLAVGDAGGDAGDAACRANGGDAGGDANCAELGAQANFDEEEAMSTELLQHGLHRSINRHTEAGNPDAPQHQQRQSPEEEAQAQELELALKGRRAGAHASQAEMEGSLTRKSFDDRNFTQTRGTTESGTYDCTFNHTPWTIVNPELKGMCIDDDTFEGCSNKFPINWPGTNQPITSIRLFKPWGLTQPRIFKTDMKVAWEDMLAYTKLNNVQYLVGVSVTCNTKDDDAEFKAALEFINFIGPDHVMGLAVGNEADIAIAGESLKPLCRPDMFDYGGYLKRLVARTKEFDKIEGMSEKPVTMVLSALGLTEKNTKLLQGAYDAFGSRFVASFNLYPQFSMGLALAGCQGSVDVGTKFTMENPAGFVPAVVNDYRTKMDAHGWTDMKLWISEIGWSTHSYCPLHCDLACHSRPTQKKFYENYLGWDSSAGASKADHTFFFTLRDSRNFDHVEEFGLIGKCEDTECKF